MELHGIALGDKSIGGGTERNMTPPPSPRTWISLSISAVSIYLIYYNTWKMTLKNGFQTFFFFCLIGMERKWTGGLVSTYVPGFRRSALHCCLNWQRPTGGNFSQVCFEVINSTCVVLKITVISNILCRLLILSAKHMHMTGKQKMKSMCQPPRGWGSVCMS